MTRIVQSETFASWLGSLKDVVGKSKVIVRIKRLEQGHMGDVKHFDGISEMRIDYGPGYRVYFAREGAKVYLLLCGGNKSSQKQDIRQARKLWAARQRNKQPSIET
ncbi:type II toxin-antitoxin system RelE/ParE family toxin [Dyella sedimenti]|uniref:type II toxin-antitoxin system RelE/ParE family toxin n=1 Tax=Dyella sedimenti TaxID=2919947 RepID=UPI001FAA1190|nr:type II toxin-antitoxin system RelE/ParE family toxin [Dyella sedimenti]